MKNINISKRMRDKSPREIFLGNGKRLVFTSKRETARFIAETNRYLTKVLVALNDVYVHTFREYRSMWFITSNTNSGTRSSYLRLEESIKKDLEACDFIFQKFTNGWGSNDPYFAFVDLRKIALFLKDAAGDLAGFYKLREHTGNYYICLNLVDRCTAIIAKLEAYDYDYEIKNPA